MSKVFDGPRSAALEGLALEAEGGPEVARRRRLILWTAISANLFGNVGLTGINVALPAIQRSFNLSAVQGNWVVMATMLVMAMFSAPTARFSDLYGRRLVTVVGLWAVVVFSAWSALAGSFASLVAARALSGLGLVAFFTTVTTMVVEAYPKSERGRVLGVAIASVYIGLSLGPVITGFLVEHLGWRALFWFTLAGMIPSMILLHLVPGETPVDQAEKLDVAGAVLWVLAVGFGFSGLASLGRPLAVPALVVGLALGVAFFLKSLRVQAPLLDLRLFLDSRRFTFSSLAAFISYLSSTSVALLLSLYFQYSKGLSPSKAGLLLMAQPVLMALLTPLAGRLSDRIDPGKLASAGMAAILASVLIFAFTFSPETPLVATLGAMALTGAGFALFSAPNSNAIMSSVPTRRLGQASGVITVTRLCGQISSMSVTTLVFGLIIGPGVITPEKHPAFLHAASVSFLLFAPLCLAGILASLARGREPAENM
ncbi:MAG: MFS transporter [Deltaproteobacteria bacterium]|jgi:MFS family permease|nr:MFS transporter [Deltaproteobacteria bacterium]